LRLWTIPTIYTGASVAAATIIPRLERAFAPDLVHGMSPAAAMAFLTATASGILSFTAIVFSIAFVMVQFSAMAYSPRLVLWFANRPMLYHALGTFIATFVYAMATLIWTDRGGNGSVPFVSMLIVLALLVASMGCFVVLVQGLGKLQITDVLGIVGAQGRDVIAAEERARALAFGATPRRLVPAPSGLHAPAAVLRHLGEPRCVTSIDVVALLRAAEAGSAVLVLQAAVGDTLVEGSTVLEIHGGDGAMDKDRLVACIRVGPERTFEQDPKYPIRLLVDIAIKALSPAINDPTTAVQALDQIDDLLRRLSRLDLGSIWLADAQGQARLFVPLPDWEDYLSLAFDEIRQFGLTSVQVMRRMRAALLGLEEMLERDDRRPAVRRYLAHLDRAIAASEFDPTDRATARQIDPQGLGFSRAPHRDDDHARESPKPKRAEPRALPLSDADP
jgi:uncharacterized membrane protein